MCNTGEMFGISLVNMYIRTYFGTRYHFVYTQLFILQSRGWERALQLRGCMSLDIIWCHQVSVLNYISVVTWQDMQTRVARYTGTTVVSPYKNYKIPPMLLYYYFFIVNTVSTVSSVVCAAGNTIFAKTSHLTAIAEYTKVSDTSFNLDSLP